MQDAGVEERRVGQIEVPVYGAAKTVTDSFRFRCRLGIDIAVEMLRLFHARKKTPGRELLDCCGREVARASGYRPLI